MDEEEMVEEEEEDVGDEGLVVEEQGDGEGGAGGDEEEQNESSGQKGTYNARDVNDQVFDELVLGPGMAEEVLSVWNTFLRSAESREAAGEAIYAALFDSAPSLQSLFKTPRAVMAMRFMNGLAQIIASLGEPKALKVVVETLGFQHLDLEVTPPRVVIFRDAIVDLLAVEMGARFTKLAAEGFNTFLNYVGGSYIYVRSKFTVRLKITSSSWATANKKADELAEQQAAKEEGEEDAQEGEEADEGEEFAKDAEEVDAKEKEKTKAKGKS